MPNLHFNEPIVFSARGTKIETTLGTLSTFPTSKLHHLAQKLFERRTSERLDDEAIYGQNEPRAACSTGHSLGLQDSVGSNELSLDNSPLSGRCGDANSQDDLGIVDEPSQHAQRVHVYKPDPAYKPYAFRNTNDPKLETSGTFGYDPLETKRQSPAVNKEIPISSQNPRFVRKRQYEQSDSDDKEFGHPSISQLAFQLGSPSKRRRFDMDKPRAEEGFFIDRDPLTFLKLLAYHDVVATNDSVVYEDCVAREAKYWKIEYPETPKTSSCFLCLITIDVLEWKNYVAEFVELAPGVEVPRKWADIKHPDEFQLMKIVSRIAKEERWKFAGLGGDVVREGEELYGSVVLQRD
jgi:hypothetical protein